MNRTNANVAATANAALAWVLLVLAALGMWGSVLISTWAGGIVWLLVGGGAVWYLLTLRRRSASAAKAAIAARADEQNERYLQGDPAGVFGEFHPGRVD